MKNLKKIYLFLTITLALLIISCGRKGDPVIEKRVPPSVKDITVTQKDMDIEIAWSYPKAEQEKIKGFRILKSDIKNNKDLFKEVAFLNKSILNFIDEDLKENETYLYKIMAVSQKGREGEESIISVSPTEPLKAPIGLNYSLKDDYVEIRWQPSDSARYYVYKSYEKGNFKSPLNHAPISETSFRDKIERERIVYYAIKAVKEDRIKIESHLSEEIEINPDTFIPSRPEKPTYIISERGIYLIWRENPETWIKGYRIYKKDKEDREFKAIGETILPTFLDKEMTSSERLYFITAIGTKKESQPSEPVGVVPLLER